MDDLTPRLLVDLLRDHIIPDKSLGQHFLLDKKVISRSIEMCTEEGHPINSKSRVLEIGPGPGSLTLFLLRSKATVIGIEIDQEIIVRGAKEGESFEGLDNKKYKRLKSSK